MLSHYAHQIAATAQRAILYEVSASPKPGLVDRYDAGAHKDMDFYTFMDSSAALYRGFFDCAAAGLSFEGADLTALLRQIRPLGIAAERAMFNATKAVNTHKGVLFSLGIACGAVGYLLKHQPGKAIQIEGICQVVAAIGSGLIEKELEPVKDKASHLLTNGEKLYLHHGITGVRGEVESGFHSIQKQVLGLMREKDHWLVNDWLLEMLLRLMQTTEDSNVIYRGGMVGLEMVQAEATAFILSGGMKQDKAYERLSTMNERFTDLRLSPGGAADLLSVAVFMALIEGAFVNEEDLCQSSLK